MPPVPSGVNGVRLSLVNAVTPSTRTSPRIASLTITMIVLARALSRMP